MFSELLEASSSNKTQLDNPFNPNELAACAVR